MGCFLFPQASAEKSLNPRASPERKTVQSELTVPGRQKDGAGTSPCRHFFKNWNHHPQVGGLRVIHTVLLYDKNGT